VEIRPARAQVDDLLGEVKRVALAGYRTLVTTLTKRMAEDLTEYLHEHGVRVRYMPSDIDTIERIEIIRTSGSAPSTCLVGINLRARGRWSAQGSLRAQETFLVGVEDRHQSAFGNVEALAQQVDADQHVEGAERRSRMISMRSMVSMSECM